MPRQVPKKYTIIGGGRVARHMAHFFSLENIPFVVWDRDADSKLNSFPDSDNTSRLQRCLNFSNTTLILIKDDAIAGFVSQYSEIIQQQMIHFSGALNVPGVLACHPLMTFSQQMYAQQTYRQIPFVVDEGTDFKDIFPQLINPHTSINPAQRAYYHSLCVIAGNFAQTLWREVGQQFEHDLGIQPSFLFPYLQQNTLNFVADPSASATGPIARKDLNTVEKHLSVLKSNKLEEIYKSFIDFSASKKTDHTNEINAKVVNYEY